MTNLAIDITPKLSNASKMPCKSFSLQAGDTCPGQHTEAGLDPVCADCYAQKGRYEMDNVVKLREHNKLVWKMDSFEADMVKLIGKRKMFRWFDSGDCYDIRLAHKLLNIMKATPGCKHWLPTRMGRFAKFEAVLAEMQALPNVVVRHSAVGYDTLPTHEIGSMVTRDEPTPEGVHACPAYATDAGTCRKAGCFACWDKAVPVIAYPGH